jgi:glycosyltransferase involved in cell wall biosynthesis
MSMRNSAATVADAVRSLQLQTLSSWELVVIDDGSHDASAAVVEDFADPRIRLVREAESRGLAARLNQAVGLARGEFIARMDSDDICFPERLERQINALRNDPSLDLLASSAVVFNDSGALIGLLPVFTGHDEIVDRPFEGIPMPHPTWCGRAAWFRANPYDAALLKAEDQDLLLRSHRHSRFGALDEVLLAYRQNRLDLAKILPGRHASIRSIWRYGRGHGEYFQALEGIAAHLAKGAVDVVTIGAGLNAVMQRQRLRAVPAMVEERWQTLRKDLRQERRPSYAAAGTAV